MAPLAFGPYEQVAFGSGRACEPSKAGSQYRLMMLWTAPPPARDTVLDADAYAYAASGGTFSGMVDSGGEDLVAGTAHSTG